MKTLDPTLVRVLEALGIKHLNEVQELSLFTGDIVGVASGGIQVLSRAAGRRRVDTSGFE